MTPVTASDDDEHEEGYRPSKIEHLRIRGPYPLEKGELEFDLVSAFRDFDDGNVTDVKFEIEYGLLENLLVEVEISAKWLDPDGAMNEKGLEDIELATKYSLPTIPGLLLDTAIGAEVSIPAGDESRGLGKNLTALEFVFSMGRGFGPVLILADLTAEVQEAKAAEYGVNLAVDWRPGDRPLNLQMATNIEYGPGAGPAVSLVPGVQYQFGEFEIGVGIPIGLTQGAQDWGVILGMEIEF